MDRNQLISAWRSRNPNSWMLPDSTAFYAAVQEEEQRGSSLDEPIKNEYQDIKTANAPGLFTEATYSVKAGVDRAQAKLYGMAEMAGDTAGLDSVSTWGKEGRQRNEAQAAEEWKPTVASVDDIRSPKEFAYWLTGLVGSQAPVIGATMAAGAATAAMAPEAGLAALIAPAVIGFSQSQNYGELKDAGGEGAMPLAVANGLIGAAVNTVGPYMAARRAALAAGMTAAEAEKTSSSVISAILGNTPSPLMRVALYGAKEGSKEMLLNIAQEAATMATEAISQHKNPDFQIDPEKIRNRLTEAGVAGFVMGGGMGAFEGYAHKAPGAEPTPVAATETTQADVAEAPPAVARSTAPSLDAELPWVPRREGPVDNSQFQSIVVRARAQRAGLGLDPYAGLREQGQTEAQPSPVDSYVAKNQPLRPLPVDAETSFVGFQEPVIQGMGAPEPHWLVKFPGADRAEGLTSEALKARGFLPPEIPAQPAPAAAPTAAPVLPHVEPIAAQPGEPVAIKAPASLSDIRSQAANLRLSETPTEEATPVIPKIKAPEEAPVKAPEPISQIPEPVPAQVAPTPSPEAIINPNGLQEKGQGRLQEVVAPPPTAVESAAVAAPLSAEPPKSTPATEPNDPLPNHQIRGVATDKLSDNHEYILSETYLKGENERTTRTVAVIQTEDGKTLLVPVAKTRSGDPLFLTEKKLSRVEHLRLIAEDAHKTLGDPTAKIAGNSTVSDVLQYPDREVGPKVAARNKALVESAKKLGWYSDEGSGISETEATAKFEGKVESYLRLDKPVEPGVYDYTHSKEMLARKIAEGMQSKDSLPTYGTKPQKARIVSADNLVAAPDAKFRMDTASTESTGATGVTTPAPKTEEILSKLRTERTTPSAVEPKVTARPSSPRETPAWVVGALPSDVIESMADNREGMTAKRLKSLLNMKDSELLQKYGAEYAEFLPEKQQLLFDALTPAGKVEAIRHGLNEVAQVGGSHIYKREAAPETYRPTAEKEQTLTNTLTREMAARGMNSVFSSKNELSAHEIFKTEGGAVSIDPSNRTALFVVGNVMEPSSHLSIDMLHEILHDQVKQLPDWLQTSLHDMIDRLPNAERAYYMHPDADWRVRTGDNPANLPKSELRLERMIEHLTLKGIDKESARSMIGTFFRSVKEHVLRAAMWLQKQLLGEDNVGGKLAEAYADNMVTQIVSGDMSRLKGFAEQFGLKPTYGQIARYVAHDGMTLVQPIDPRTGRVSYAEAPGLDHTTAAYNIERHFIAAKESIMSMRLVETAEAERTLAEALGGDADLLHREAASDEQRKMIIADARTKAIQDAHINSTVQNQLSRFYRRLYEHEKRINPETTFDQFMDRFTIANPEAVKETGIDTLVTRLKEDFNETVDVSKTPLFDEAALIDDLPEGLRQKAELQYLHTTRKHIEKHDALIQANNAKKTALSTAEEAHRATVKEVNASLMDQKVTEKFAKDFIRSSLDQIKQLTRREARAEYMSGEADGILSQLEESLGQNELRAKYTDRLINDLDVNGLGLFSVMRGFYELEQRSQKVDSTVDFSKMSAVEIRKLVKDDVTVDPNSVLRPLVSIGSKGGSEARGTAMLAAFISFVKNESHMAEIIRAQMDKTSAGRDAMLKLRDVLNETNESKLKEIRDSVSQDLKPLGNRLIQKMLNKRDASKAALKQLEKLNGLGRSLETARDALTQTEGVLEQRRDISDQLHYHTGAKFPNPLSVTETPEQLRGTQYVLSMDKTNFLKSKDVRDIIRNQGVWLEHNKDKPEYQGAIYNSVKEARARLVIAIGSDHVNATISGWKDAIFGSISDVFKNTGTQTGAMVQRMFVRKAEIENALKNEGHTLGKKWESAREAVMNATGLTADGAREALYRPMCRFMENSLGLTEEEAFVKLRQHLSADPKYRELLSKAGAWDKLVSWGKASREYNQWEVRKSTEHGNKVLDDKLTGQNIQTGASAAQLRAPIEQGVTGYTFSHNFHDSIKSAVNTMKSRERALGDGIGNPFRDVGAKLALHADEVGAALKSFFTPDIRQAFLDPLITNDHNSSLPSPHAKLALSYEVAERLWRESNGDLLTFGKKVFAEKGKDSGMTEHTYVEKLINWVGGKMEGVINQISPEKEESSSALGAAHFAMDSRKADDYPAEWIAYPEYSADVAQSRIRTIAGNAAFGRDLADLKSAIVNVREELQSYVTELGNTPEQREANKLAHKDDKGWYEKRIESEKMLQSMQSIERVIADIHNPTKGLNADSGLLMDVFGTMLTGMLTGPKTAVSQLGSVSDTWAVERSISGKSLQTVGRGYAAVGKYFAGAVSRIFGANMLADDANATLIKQAGDFERASSLSNKEISTRNRGHDNSLDHSATGRIQSILRTLRDVVTDTKVGGGKEGTGPVVRLFNQFQFIQTLSNYAITDSLMDRYRELIRLGAEYYAADKTRVGESLTAEKIGYSDVKGFNSLQEEALQHGIILETLAEQSVKKIAKGDDVMDVDTTRKLMNMALSRVAGESNATNRPTFALTSRFAKMNASLVGWSFFKSGTLLKMMRDPQGRSNALALLNGMKVIGLGLIPASFAFSYLLDEYDEKITGKKSNLRPLSMDDLLGTMLERSVAVGTFGIVGNFADMAKNVKDGSGQKLLSVDQRIVWVNSVIGMIKTTADLQAMGGFENANYANFYRRVMQATGMGGVLQYIQVANRMFEPELPLFKEEASVTARINAGNLLRAAGRETGLEVRAMGGTATPTPLTPWVSNMALAAYSNDIDAFREAYKGALEVAKKLGKEDPAKAVAESYASRNPLKSLFASPVTQQEYQKMLAAMPEAGRAAVQQAVASLNKFGQQIGATPFVGAPSASPQSLAKMRAKRIQEASDSWF